MYAFLLLLLKLLNKKIVITFHTVFSLKHLKKDTLKTFNIKYPLTIVKNTIKLLTKLYALSSHKIIVHTQKMKETLTKQYKIPPHKVTIIPHYVKKLPKIDKNEAKRKLNLQGKNILLLFGLIRKGKGYENVIKALQKIVEKSQNTILLIVGTVQKGKIYQGEQYLKKLKKLVKTLKLQNHVKFITKYIPDEELPIYFNAADILILPYEKGKSYYSSSGILQLAVSFGTPLIAAKTLHFAELENIKNRRLVDPKNTEELANTTIELLNNQKERKKYQEALKKLAENKSTEKCAQKHWKLYQKLMETKTQSKIKQILPHILVLIPYLLMIVKNNPINTGNDILPHIYKAWILKQQIQSLPPWLWGQWDWTWYLGNPFLRTYSPLPYYIIATLTLILPFWTTTKTILAIITPLAYISTYKALKHFTQNKNISITFATIYIYSPTHTVPLYMWGSIGQALTTPIIPLHLIQLDKTTRTNQNKNIVTTAITLATIILLNLAVGFWITTLTTIWLLTQKQPKKLFKTGTLTALLTSPFLYNFLTTKGTMLPVLFTATQTKYIAEWLKNVYKITTLQVELLIVSYIVAALLYLKFRKKTIKHKKPYWEKILEITTIIIIITLIFSSIPLYPFSIVGGDRTLTTSGFIVIFMGAYYYSKLKTHKHFKKILITLTIMALITAALCQPHSRPNPEKYTKIYQTIKNDPEWFRVLFLPREPWGAITPLYTDHPTLNGWYPQCLPPEVFQLLGSLVAYDKYAYLEKNITKNPEKTINTLKYLGVKYIIVDEKDPQLPQLAQKITQTLLKTANTTKQITLMQSDTQQYLFKIENYTPIYALNYIPQNVEDIPTKTEKINNIQITQKTNSLEICINISQNYWIIIPILYDKKLKVTVDGEPSRIEIAYPKLIAIKTAKGVHKIKIEVTVTAGSKIIFIISCIAWVMVTAYAIKQNRLIKIKEILTPRITHKYTHNAS
nr:glycosyltransferase [Candidatus Baldrarchaeota archaeon]